MWRFGIHLYEWDMNEVVLMRSILSAELAIIGGTKSDGSFQLPRSWSLWNGGRNYWRSSCCWRLLTINTYQSCKHCYSAGFRTPDFKSPSGNWRAHRYGESQWIIIHCHFWIMDQWTHPKRIDGFSSGYLWLFLWNIMEPPKSSTASAPASAKQRDTSGLQTYGMLRRPVLHLWSSMDVLYEKHHVTPLNKGGNLIRKKETPEIDVQIPYVMNFHDISWGIYQFLSPLLPWCFWTMMRMTRIKPWSLGGMGANKGLWVWFIGFSQSGHFMIIIKCTELYLQCPETCRWRKQNIT